MDDYFFLITIFLVSINKCMFSKQHQKFCRFCDHLCRKILLKGIVVFGLEAFHNVHHLLIMCNFLVFVM
jgi:hypothetical protein